MGGIKFYLFGHFSVFREPSGEEIKLTRRIQSLLAYLLIYRYHTHSRDTLAGLFWGESSQENARKSLNTTIWRLRQCIEPPEIDSALYITTTSTGEIGFNRLTPYWLDIAEFADQAERSMKVPVNNAEQESISQLEMCLGYYTGDLLEGFYEDWVVREREHLRVLYQKSLTYLMEYYKGQSDYEKSLGFGLKILEMDPLREDIHREIMRIYDANGQRAAGIRQYELCREILSRELGISPMLETLALRNTLALKEKPPAIDSTKNESLVLQQALAHLFVVSQAFTLVQKEFSDLIDYYQRLTISKK